MKRFFEFMESNSGWIFSIFVFIILVLGAILEFIGVIYTR